MNPKLGENMFHKIGQHDFQLDEYRNSAPSRLEEVMLVYCAASKQVIRSEQENQGLA